MATSADAVAAAMEHHRAGRLDKAAGLYQAILEDNPAHPDALHLMGLLSHQVGENVAAVDWISRAIATNPDQPLYHNNLGEACRALGRLDQAQASYRQAVRLKPDFVEAHLNLGNACLAQGRLDEASESYRQALRICPDYAPAHNNLGTALQELGELQEAVACFQHAVRINPDYAEAHTNLGNVLQKLGDGSALSQYERAIELHPQFASAYYHLAAMDPSAVTEVQMAQLEQLRKSPGISSKDRSSANFAMGIVLDHRRDFDRAFACFEEANRVDDPGYDAQQQADFVSALIATYSARFFATTEPPANRSGAPIFIVGMPRSGSTLVEQIISSHSRVCGAGEMKALKEIVQAVPEMTGASQPYPQAAAQLNQDDRRILAQQYLDRVRAVAGDADHVTDKTLDNFHHLGLIAQLFPEAHVIVCRRNELDVCLSCFFRRLVHLPFSFDLQNLGFYYRQYDRLMKHWQTVLPLKIHEVEYEPLVADQENVSRRLLADCGLSWEACCLEFHRNKRPVSTAALWQVRQPIYSHCVDRWKHYQRHLGPLESALAGSEASPANMVNTTLENVKRIDQALSEITIRPD